MTSVSDKQNDESAAALRARVGLQLKHDPVLGARMNMFDSESSASIDDGDGDGDGDDAQPAPVQPQKRTKPAEDVDDELELDQLAELYRVDDPVEFDEPPAAAAAAGAGSAAAAAAAVEEVGPASPEHSEDVEHFDEAIVARISEALEQPVDESRLSVPQRFKRWLGVHAGEHMAELERAVRQERPTLGDAEVRKAAEARLRAEERAKKSVHERYVADEKACRLLLRAYFEQRDAAALDIYMAFQREHIALVCGADQRRRRRRVAEVERSVSTCERHLTQQRQTLDEVVDCMLKRHPTAAALPIDAVRESLVASAPSEAPPSSSDSALVRLSTVEGDVSAAVPGAVRSAASFVAAYTADLTRSASQVQQRHCAGLASSLVSAINLTAALVSVAPDDALFFMGNEAGPAAADGEDPPPPSAALDNHPISAMRRIIEHAVPDAPISEQALVRYMRQWSRTQSESPDDIDRALARVYREQEMDEIARAMRSHGIDGAELEASLAYGIDPEQSQMMRAVLDFVDNEQFREAHRNAVQHTKLRERYAAHDRKMEQVRRRAQQANGGVTVEDVDDEGAGAGAGAQPFADYDIEQRANAHESFYLDAARQLECCSRQYLARYMRAPAGPQFSERECVNGLKCICLTLSAPFPALGSNMGGYATANVSGSGAMGVGHSLERDDGEPFVAGTQTTPASIVGRHQQGFVCREFLKPSQEAKLLATGALPEIQQACLLCNRRATTHLYHQYTQQHGAGLPREPLDLLQDHCVAINERGEYDAAACLLTTFRERHFTGIVKPFVGYSAAHYRYSSTAECGQVLPCLVETTALDFRLASDSATRT